MFKGYLELGGHEIGNSLRVDEYVRKNAPTIAFEDKWDSDGLLEALGDEVYESPAVDDAPWLDPSNPATADFFGFAPLDVQGMSDSTRRGQVTETVSPGGVVGEVRDGPRTIRVRGLLVARNDLALEAGHTWLNAALRPSNCTSHGGSCGGAQLCYYAAKPVICDAWEKDYLPLAPVPFTASNGRAFIARDLGVDGPIYQAAFDDEPFTTTGDGTIIRWGAVSPDDTRIAVEDYGPVVLSRTNRQPNGRFAAGTTGWTLTGDGVLEVIPTGGVRDDAYGQVTVTTGPVVLEAPTVTPQAGMNTVSFAAYAEVETAVQVSVVQTADDVEMALADFTIQPGWGSYNLPVELVGPVRVTFGLATDGAIVGFSDVMVEVGETPLPFFDGSFDEDTAMAGYLTQRFGPEYEIAWTGAVNNSPSTARWLGHLNVGAPLSRTFDQDSNGSCDSLPIIIVVQGQMTGFVSVKVRPRIPAEVQALPYERTMHDVTCVEGALTIRNLPTTNGAMREVEFILVAGKPYAYSTTETLIEPTRMSDLPTVAWGVDACDTAPTPPLLDPDCVIPPAPPRAPEIANECVDLDVPTQRYWLEVPGERISVWSDMTPIVRIASGVQAIRQVRVRAFPNPFDRPVPDALDRRYNRATNPQLAVDASFWRATGGTSTSVGRVAVTLPDGTAGYAYRRVVDSAAPPETMGVESYSATTAENQVTAGLSYAISIYGRFSTSRSAQMRVVWRNAAGGVISTVYADTKAVVAGAWSRFSAVLVAPAGATRVDVAPVGEGLSVFITGNTIEATWLLIDEDVTTVVPFWDGSGFVGGGLYTQWVAQRGLSASVAAKSPVDPCSWCSEFIVSYLPPNTELTVDAILERAFASVAGAEAQPVNHLMYGSDGGPMTWPALSCGNSYLIAIDVPEPLLDDVIVSLELARRE